jgi:hypothetical protein
MFLIVHGALPCNAGGSTSTLGRRSLIQDRSAIEQFSAFRAPRSEQKRTPGSTCGSLWITRRKPVKDIKTPTATRCRSRQRPPPALKWSGESRSVAGRLRRSDNGYRRIIERSADVDATGADLAGNSIVVCWRVAADLFNSHQRTYAAQQTAGLFDHLVGAWLTITAALCLGRFVYRGHARYAQSYLDLFGQA